jgi:hypothetical protein
MEACTLLQLLPLLQTSVGQATQLCQVKHDNDYDRDKHAKQV